MPLTIQEREQLRQEILSRTAPQNDYLAMVSKLPQEDALKILHKSVATGLNLQEAAKYPHAVIENMVTPEEFEVFKKDSLKTYEFLQDPIYMATVRSKQKIKQLAELEKRGDAATALSNGLKGIVRAGLGFGTMLTDLAKAGKETEPLTLNTPLFSMQTMKRAATTFIPDKVVDIADENIPNLTEKYLAPKEVKAKTKLGQFGYDVLENGPQLLAQVAMAYITKGATIPTMFMGTQIAGGQYIGLKKDGVDSERAFKASTANALLQAPLEKIGLNRLMKFGNKTNRKMLEVLETALAEGFTEWIQEYPEAASDIWAKNANLSTEEQVARFIDEFGAVTKQGLYSGAIGAVYGGLGGGIKVALHKNLNNAAIENIYEDAEAMKNSGLEPAILQAHQEKIAPGEKVYIEAKALVSYAQSGLDEISKNLGVNEDAIEKAAQSGQRVEVPLSKFKTTIMENQEFGSFIRKDVSIVEGGLTLNQTSMYNSKIMEKAQEKILKDDAELYSTQQEIYDQWKVSIGNLKNINTAMLKNAMTALVSHAKIMAPIENITVSQWLKNNAPVVQKGIYTKQKGLTHPITNRAVNLDELIEIVNITPKFEGRDWRELRKKKGMPEEVKKELISGGPVINEHTNKKILITSKSFEHFRNTSVGGQDVKERQTTTHFELIRMMRVLLKKAVLVETHNDKLGRKELKGIQRMFVPAKVGDSLYIIKLTVREYANGFMINDSEYTPYLAYDHSIADTKKGELRTSSNDQTDPRKPMSPPLSNISIREMLKNVNDNFGEPYIKDDGTGNFTNIEKNEIDEYKNGLTHPMNVDPLNLNLYDVIIEKNRPAARVINNNDGKPAANDSLSKLSIKDMLSGVKDYDGNNYFQEAQDPRGLIQWGKDGRAIISLFENADASTVVHEMVGHYFIQNLIVNGQLDNAPQWLKNARKTMLDFAGVENWEKATDEEKVQAHEKWASAAETYLLEGNAPSMELRSVFRKFKDWLVSVYKQLKQSQIEITPEVRDVFDRLLASDEAIKENEIVERYYEKLPENILEKLSEVSLRALDKALMLAHDKAEEIARKTIMENITKDKKAEMKIDREETAKIIEKMVSEEPLYKAIDTIRESFKDNAKTLAENYIAWQMGEDVALSEKSEFEFELLAEGLGFSSANELAQKILNSPSKKEAVQAKVNEYIKQKYIDVYGNKELIANEARKAMYNDDGAFLLALERQVIDEQLGKILKADERRKLAAQERELMRIEATKVLSQLPMKKAVRYKEYMRAERNAHVQAAKALKDKDFEKAKEWKVAQLYNHMLTLGALDIRRNFTNAKNYMHRQQKAKKETWKKEEHFNQAATLLSKFGFERKDYVANDYRESLDRWLNRMNKENENLYISPWLMFQQEDLSLNELNIEQVMDIVNALKTIKHAAQYEDKFFRDDITSGIEEKITSLENNLANRKNIYQHEAQPENQSRLFQEFFTSARKITTSLLDLDGWKDFGEFYNLIYKPVYEAANNASNILHDTKNLIKSSLETRYSKEDLKKMYVKKYYPELNSSVNKHYLIEMASHIGNEHNFNVLASTKPIGLESNLWIDNDIEQTKSNLIGFLEKNLNHNDWLYVQDRWDTINKLWPLAQKVHTKMTGFSMRKVEATPFSVRLVSGETISLEGGYYPLKEDYRASNIAEKRNVESTPLYTEGVGLYVPKTFTGYTNKRNVHARYSIDLNTNNIYRHIGDVIHDISFREVITDLRRLVNNKRFKSLIMQKAGPETFKSIQDFVAAAATNKTEAASIGQKSLDSIINIMREKVTISALMFNLKTALQNMANPFLYGNSVDGFDHVDSLKAFLNGGVFGYLTSKERFIGDRSFVLSKSAFMRDRVDTPDFTLNELKDAKENYWLKWGGRLLAETDNLTCIPVWIEAYNKKIASGSKETEAILFADTLVERSIGSGRKIDTASLLRGNQTSRLLTMFGSFMNTQYNAWVREKGIFLRDKDVVRLTTFVGAKFLLFSIAGLLLAGNVPDDSDDKWVKEWSSEILSYPVRMIPIFGTISGVALNNIIGANSFGFRLSPIESAGDAFVEALKKTKGVYEGKNELFDLAETGTKLASYAYGYPQQFNRWFWNGYDILFNDMDPEAIDLMRRRPKKER